MSFYEKGPVRIRLESGECPLWVKSRHCRSPNDVRFAPKSRHQEALLGCPLCAKSGLMQCSKQPVNLGTTGQVLGSLTDYNFASADEDDLGVLRSIAPSHHGYIVEIDPNGLCFQISALHPRCHSGKLSLPGRNLAVGIPLGAKSRHCAAQHSVNVVIVIRAKLNCEQER